MIKWIAVLLCVANATFAADAQFLSSYTWRSPSSAFGGLSSIHLDNDGQTLLATSDRGYFISGKITRKADKITGLTNQKILPIQNTKGKHVTGWGMDSEGIAIRPDGRIYVSFEHSHRVWTYPTTTSKAAWIPKHKDFKFLQDNSGLEALAIDRRGWLYAIPERSGVLTRPFPVYRYNGKKWDKKLNIPRKAPFLVVGADFGPDNKLYVLERDFKFPSGFATRIRRFTLTASGFQNQETLLETRLGLHDNLEGISVWKDKRNRIRITLVSDNNFKFFQRTELVEYVVQSDGL